MFMVRIIARYIAVLFLNVFSFCFLLLWGIINRVDENLIFKKTKLILIVICIAMYILKIDLFKLLRKSSLCMYVFI